MTLTIRTLPIEERWDCHACGICCQGGAIPLSTEELQRVRQQQWHKHPDYLSTRVVERQGFFSRRYRVTRRRDGRCVFLTPDRRCGIHQEHGEAAKPLTCRMFPLQVVPLGDDACLTLRRYCPSAAAGEGRPLDEHLGTVRKLLRQRPTLTQSTRPPTITPGHRRPWNDTLRVAEVIQRLMLDGRYPLVRRLVHGLQFCRLLEMCRLRRLSSERLGPLLAMLEKSAVEEAGDLFLERQPPRRAAAALFRQAAFEYARLHVRCTATESWRARFRLLGDAIAFGRGKGRVPSLCDSFPEATFQDLERPLGHLGIEVLDPLKTYFETAAASKRYAVTGRRRWPMVESFRALALSYPVAMWILRLACGDRPPVVEEVIEVIGAIDRGQGYDSLIGRRHRLRVSAITRLGGLPRLVAWYSR